MTRITFLLCGIFLLFEISVTQAQQQPASVSQHPAGQYRMLAKPTQAFTAWQKRSGDRPPDFANMRSMPYLPPLLEFYNGKPVRTLADWNQRKAEIRRLLRTYFLGQLPKTAPQLVNVRILNESRFRGAIDRQVELTFNTKPKVSITVEMMLPAGDGPFPVFMTQSNHRRWGLIALNRGYIVCLYPGADINNQADRFIPAYPGLDWTDLQRRAWMAGRALDYVMTLKQVKKTQIGISGHSRNGKQSLIAAAFDERFTAVVSSSSGAGGVAPYRYANERGYDEGVELMTGSPITGDWFHQRLRFFTGREDKLPIDNHALLGLIAPRACLLSDSFNDAGGQTFSTERSYLAAREVYRFLEKPEALRIRWRPGAHETIVHDIESYFDWFDRAFGRGKIEFPEELIHFFDWKKWRTQFDDEELLPPNNVKDSRRLIRWGLGEEPASGISPGGKNYGVEAGNKAVLVNRLGNRGKVTNMRVNFGEYVPGNLYYRKDLKGPLPVVIWLHPYCYSLGHSGSFMAGTASAPHFLAENGFAVLAFDLIGFGIRLHEGSTFYDRYPRWSRLGKMVHDVRSAIDFIRGADELPFQLKQGHDKLSLPKLDHNRIFLLGYSVGGMVGLYSAALDNRITGVACFSGFTPMRTDTDAKPTGGIRRYWELHALQPRLGLFHGREQALPYDFDDILKAIAPRPCLIVSPMHDRDADWTDVTDCVDSARKVWQSQNASKNLTHLSPDDYNRFHSDQHRILLKWMNGVVSDKNQ